MPAHCMQMKTPVLMEAHVGRLLLAPEQSAHSRFSGRAKMALSAARFFLLSSKVTPFISPAFRPAGVDLCLDIRDSAPPREEPGLPSGFGSLTCDSLPTSKCPYLLDSRGKSTTFAERSGRGTKKKSLRDRGKADRTAVQSCHAQRRRSALQRSTQRHSSPLQVAPRVLTQLRMVPSATGFGFATSCFCLESPEE